MKATVYVIVAGVFWFYMQYIFCRKAKKNFVKILPSVAVATLTVLDVLILTGVLGADSPPQEFNKDKVEALIFFVVAVSSAVGVAAAWLVSAVKARGEKEDE